MKCKYGFWFCVVMMFLSVTMFVAADEYLDIVLTPKSTGTVRPNTDFVYIFNFTDDISCVSFVYSFSQNITTDNEGTAYVRLNVSNFTYMPQYLCEYRNGSLRKNHAKSIYLSVFGSSNIKGIFKGIFNMSTTGTINASAFYDDGVLLTTLTPQNIIDYVGNWSDDQSSYWDTSDDLDTVIINDEIAEAKIEFTTACAAGDYYRLNGNDLECTNPGAVSDTVDGNASSFCDGDTTYLDGDGNCDDLSGVYLTSYENLTPQNIIDYVGNWSADSSSYWDTSTDLDTVISADEIAESKIEFTTACASGNHYYLNGNDLACEADDDTTYTADETWINLISTTFNFDIASLIANIGNWSLDNIYYYNKTEIDSNNATLKTYIDTQDSAQDACSEITGCVENAITSYENLTFAEIVTNIGNWSADSSSYWDTSNDLDTVIGADEIAEGKIEFTTACASGNYYYLNGNDLACEADDDTTYTADETWINLDRKSVV